jgi:hypothetical protein
VKVRNLTREETARLDAIDDDWRRPLGCPLLYLGALDSLEEALNLLTSIALDDQSPEEVQRKTEDLLRKHGRWPEKRSS